MNSSAFAVSVYDRAVGYPYRIPAASYIYHEGACRELDGGAPFPDVSGRTPVLAVGSNQSPEQLARKFKGSGWSIIPVSRVSLVDFDTVYSAHITAYGSVAATLHHAPGTVVTLFVNWLDSDQLECMHKTELANENYEFGRLSDLKMDVEAGPALDAIYLYQGQRGIFAPAGSHIPLKEVPARGRSAPEMSQTEVQAHIRDRLDPEKSLETFIHESVSNAEVRAQRTQEMARHRLEFSYQGYARSAL